ncbi:hypothetical protein J5N97_025434 [Dioscorea zingiberensis]|uniref:K-box domain-containing protein n=1 Tax=Dioscorea zingiberensis TaxID=325984 RepID=A0A9D5C9I3_9LILI|nr:hypothetical protein J5N97_025434 [Dioscorea zingiberensis]
MGFLDSWLDSIWTSSSRSKIPASLLFLRMGEDLDGLDISELRGLEQNVDEALKLVRQRKYHVITTQTDTYKKKLKNSHEAHQHLLRELEVRDEHPVYGFVDNDPNNYDGTLALANAGSHVYAYQRVQPNQPNLHGIMGYNSNDLRLA